MKRFSGPFDYLKPLVYMAKDYADTYKQYKSPYYIRRDLRQPLYGFGSILLGIYHIINGVEKIGIGMLLKGHGNNITYGMKAITRGILDIVRGLTQIATTPLTWFLRMPLRGLITAFTGFTKAEASPGIQIAVLKGKRILDEINSFNQSAANLIDMDKKGDILSSADSITNTIDSKYNKARNRCQRSDIISDKRPMYVSIDPSGRINTTDFIKGLRLFDQDKSERNNQYWSNYDVDNTNDIAKP